MPIGLLKEVCGRPSSAVETMDVVDQDRVGVDFLHQHGKQSLQLFQMARRTLRAARDSVCLTCTFPDATCSMKSLGRAGGACCRVHCHVSHGLNESSLSWGADVRVLSVPRNSCL